MWNRYTFIRRPRRAISQRSPTNKHDIANYATLHASTPTTAPPSWRFHGDAHAQPGCPAAPTECVRVKHTRAHPGGADRRPDGGERSTDRHVNDMQPHCAAAKCRDESDAHNTQQRPAGPFSTPTPMRRRRRVSNVVCDTPTSIVNSPASDSARIGSPEPTPIAPIVSTYTHRAMPDTSQHNIPLLVQAHMRAPEHVSLLSAQANEQEPHHIIPLSVQPHKRAPQHIVPLSVQPHGLAPAVQQNDHTLLHARDDASVPRCKKPIRYRSPTAGLAQGFADGTMVPHASASSWPEMMLASQPRDDEDDVLFTPRLFPPSFENTHVDPLVPCDRNCLQSRGKLCRRKSFTLSTISIDEGRGIPRLPGDVDVGRTSDSQPRLQNPNRLESKNTSRLHVGDSRNRSGSKWVNVLERPTELRLIFGRPRSSLTDTVSACSAST